MHRDLTRLLGENRRRICVLMQVPKACREESFVTAYNEQLQKKLETRTQLPVLIERDKPRLPEVTRQAQVLLFCLICLCSIAARYRYECYLIFTIYSILFPIHATSYLHGSVSVRLDRELPQTATACVQRHADPSIMHPNNTHHPRLPCAGCDQAG